MDTVSTCPSCGKPLAPDAPKGLCQECLLKAGFPTATENGGKAPPFNPPTVAELAAKFPQLEIQALIGSGGMGAVYRARQKELDRTVALKVLPPGIGDDPAFAERFAREAKALARLNHPNVVTLYEFGRADGLFFFLMELVDGVNLRQLLNAGRLSAREALAVVPQICDALQYAHDEGIVHRDIKPENILLDRRGRVKVADFGLAKIVGQASSLSPTSAQAGESGKIETDGTPVLRENLTNDGKVMGTPHYMAPEQKACPGAVDHRADIYALGVVFYQMLTGELPGSRLEPPSKKVQVDVRLDEVVLHALETEPERRYQQASYVKTAIETIASSFAPTPRISSGSEAGRLSDVQELGRKEDSPANDLTGRKKAPGAFHKLVAVGIWVIAFALVGYLVFVILRLPPRSGEATLDDSPASSTTQNVASLPTVSAGVPETSDTGRETEVPVRSQTTEVSAASAPLLQPAAAPDLSTSSVPARKPALVAGTNLVRNIPTIPASNEPIARLADRVPDTNQASIERDLIESAPVEAAPLTPSNATSKLEVVSGNGETAAQEGAVHRVASEAPSSDLPSVRVSIANTNGLEFRWVADAGDTNSPADELADPNDPSGDTKLRVLRKTELDGAEVAGASLTNSPSGQQEIHIMLTEDGARKFAEATAAGTGRRLAIVWHGRVLSSPVIRDRIEGRSVAIAGNFSEAEGQELLNVLNHRVSSERPQSQPPARSPEEVARELAERFEAANAMDDFSQRDSAMAAIARDAARAADLDLTKQALAKITTFSLSDQAALEAARELKKIGHRTEAIEIARTITSFPKRDAALRELAE